MAMIKCPECGAEISSHAKSCPHCGCGISVCPDCGAAYAESPKECASCGCIFSEARTDKPEEKTARSESGSDFENKVKKFMLFQYVPAWIFAILGLAAILIACFCVSPLVKDMGAANIDPMTMKKKYDAVCSVIVLCAVMLSISSCQPVYSTVSQRIFAEKIRGNRAEYKAFLLAEEVKADRELYSSVEFLECPQKAPLRYLISVLLFAITIVGTILLAVWATGAVKDFFAKWMLALDPRALKFAWNFKDPSFIVGFIFLIGGSLTADVLYPGALRSMKRIDAIRTELKK